MMKNFILIFILALSGCNCVKQLYIQFGEKKAVIPTVATSENIIRIYFDRFGTIYPDVHIPDEPLKAVYSTLANLYRSDTSLYRNVCTRYGATKDPFLMDNTLFNYVSLQHKLVDGYADSINRMGKGKEVVFLIHGYNAYPYLENDTANVAQQFQCLRNQITNRLTENDKKFLFVEIYWDGLTEEGTRNLGLRWFNQKRIWKNAQSSASNAGLELRRILSRISKPKVFILSHSHGAAVATYALFNVLKFGDKEFPLFVAKYTQGEYTTPNIDVRVGMLAPAIPGENVFDEYFHRTPGCGQTPCTSRNFHFVLGVNTYDEVTSKRPLKGSKHGSTTLAYDPDELKKTMAIFAGDKNVIDAVDFSLTTGNATQEKHGFYHYINNPHFPEFLKMVIR